LIALCMARSIQEVNIRWWVYLFVAICWWYAHCF